MSEVLFVIALTLLFAVMWDAFVFGPARLFRARKAAGKPMFESEIGEDDEEQG